MAINYDLLNPKQILFAEINRLFNRYLTIAPKIIPLMVAMTTTSATYTTVFGVPITPRITSRLGKLNAGPAKRSASAGPFPMPDPMSPYKIGTSVSVAKYMNAAMIEEKKFALKELPPTSVSTQREGTRPS